ncbi:DUF1302 domain-containing protein [Pseudomonas shirazica]|uniref:DUF1302 domain-containing protein n=1 Tax=Pseudomonas shirazica TaxID=1940636 RepID=A0ABY9SSX9_9PSED|nr:DUF1302 domain-containing protein [Pseudomonas shirazica]WMY86591.1 DUF1302 domain-containing protein [Pseudomonas shirazica]
MAFRASGLSGPLSLLASSALFSVPALAVQFNLGEFEGQFDSAFSFGTSISTANPDPALHNSANSDDGRLNFASGDVFSAVFKGTHDLELKHANLGVFLRGTYWYDTALRDHDQHFKQVEDNNRKRSAKTAGTQLLDAFGYYLYDIDGQPGSARLGKQVVNWGESTFIQGGLNVINPFNLAALRRPGSEVKDALVPVNLFYFTQNLTEALSVDGFYQLDWDQTQLDNCGTFFSNNDFLPDGCDGLDVGARLLGNPAAVAGLAPFGVNLTSEGVRIPRGSDQDARDGGQWGVSLRWYVAALDTEFGAYAANYHSRTPYLGTVSSPYFDNSRFAPQLCANLGIGPAGCAGFLGSAAGQSLVGALRLGTSQYRVQYPEDIRMYGLSFATTLRSGTALQGELSYRPNMPMQLNGTDIIQSLLNVEGRSPLLGDGLRPESASTLFDGYRRKEVTQLQVTAVHAFSQVLGANQMLLVGEAGATYVGGLEGGAGPRYGRSGTFNSGELADNSVCRAISKTPEHCNDQGFMTPFSWGYRLRATLTYPNVIAGFDLRPNLSWSHDVHGTGPVEGSAFSEGSKAMSVGLDATLASTYSLSLSYTDFIDGDYGTRGDRDFVSLSLGVTF